ncbi:uncharacterized protein DFL_005849 [Arthrobotrys flagrans]|uniref:FAD-binding domain-containing protein n=1 Tax=Arthrobotrys flagrans TaxID=97331 RepID=A0A436ZYI7_ARTFL|nr:hypothetical protein DFL_005849 [Arthrobotrys flagrans]
MRVLISGAGIAGPSLAWFLAKAGARVTTVEKAQSLLPHGQNVDIQGSARKVIEKMGLVDEVLRFNTTEKGTQFIDPKGRPFAPFPVQKGKSNSFTSEFEILRGDLAAVFYNATKDHPNIAYLFDTTIKEVISNSPDSVKVELSTGEIQTYDLLVLSDGQWSKLRQRCFPAETIKVVDKDMFAVYWTIPRIPSDNDWWNLYAALGRRIVSLRPDPHGTIRAMFTRMPLSEAHRQEWLTAARGDRKTQEELLRKEFTDAGWQSQRLLDSIATAPDFYFQAIQQIKMDKWSTGRIVCLGDTAYAPTPLTGMGTSLAINGAFVLAGELSKLEEGEHPSKAFDSYETIFRPFVEEKQQVPSLLPGFVHPENAGHRFLISTLASALSKVVRTPWLVNRLAKMVFDDSNDEDFPLPKYSAFEDEAVVEACDGNAQ